ncbi:hypothetical protein [Nocardia tengchongensis]|uniref:hypothetical protein n=1 Tax=Nocardia tengchongensis TaxID=2055889 RepID=UPI003648ED33
MTAIDVGTVPVTGGRGGGQRQQCKTYTDHARGSFVDRSGGVAAAARARLKRPP